MLLAGVVYWSAVVFEYVVFAWVEASLLDDHWLDTAYLLMRSLRFGAGMSFASALVAFGLVAWPAKRGSPVIASHRAYLRRFGAIALSFCTLVSLTKLRMGRFDVEIGTIIVFAWSVWILAAGWRAWTREAVVFGPGGWWLALVANILAVAVVVGFLDLLAVEGGNLISG
jgi:hypothetical protein